jgi:hypothetical protein
MGVNRPPDDAAAAPGRGRVAAAIAFLGRHWIVTTLLVLVLTIRAALPWVLQPVLRDQAEAAIQAKVAIGDVDLWLLRGAIALEDVAIRSEPGAEPVIAWDKLYVRTSWPALLRRTLLLREIALVGPRVDVERLADGEINLTRLAPPPSEPAAPATAASEWRFALEKFLLEGGRVDFEDASVKGTKPIRIEVTSLQVAGGGFGAAGFEGPTKIAARLGLEGAPLQIDAEIGTGKAGWEGTVRVDGQGLPIHHAVAYSPYRWEYLTGHLDVAAEAEILAGNPKVKGRAALRDVRVKMRGAEASGAEWSTLEVEADGIDPSARDARIARIHWVEPKVVLEPGDPVPLPILRRVVDEAIVEPAAEAAREAVETREPAERTAAEDAVPPAEVTERAPEATRSPGEEAAKAAPEQAKGARPSQPGKAADPERKESDAGEQAWRWSVAKLDVEDLHVDASNADRRTSLDLELHAESLADPSERAAPLRFELKPPQGVLTGTGELRIAPLEIGADLEWKDLDVAGLVATLPQPEIAALRSARSGGRLRVRSTAEAGLAAEGEVAVSDVALEGVSPTVPRVGWKKLDLAISQLDAPGVLGGATAPARIDLARVDLEGARIAVERAAVADPTLTEEPAAESTVKGKQKETAERTAAAKQKGTAERTAAAKQKGAAEKTAAAKGAAVPTPSPGAQATPAPTPVEGAQASREPTGAAEATPPASGGIGALTVGELAVSDSHLEVLDRAVGEPVRAEVSEIDLRASGVEWPSRRIARLDLTMRGPAGANVKLTGRSQPSSSEFELDVQGLELVPFDAYGREFGGVTVAAGTASLRSSIALSEERYDTDSKLVLRGLDLSGEEGEQSFATRFGVPLGLALALLRDVQGDITLDIPVSGGREGLGVGLGKAVMTTLQRILLNALASPLKLIGSVALAGGALRGFDVEPIPFEPGTTVLGPKAADRIASLGSLLAERPQVALRLEGRIAGADLAGLREAELRRALADPKSPAAKAVAELDDEAAEAVRDYLAGAGAAGSAPAEPSAKPLPEQPPSAPPPPALAPLLAKVEVTRERLVSLGRERAEHVRAALAAIPGVAPEQLEVRPGTGEARAKQPQVIVEMASR